ncbi:MAG TPA: hypothetical protein VGB79_10975 [Allosphingosinicella sp.]
MDGAFARTLRGGEIDAPVDALGALRPLLHAPVLCSRARPYGIHADLTGHDCPRCGWVPKRRGAAAARTPLSLC